MTPPHAPGTASSAAGAARLTAPRRACTTAGTGGGPTLDTAGRGARGLGTGHGAGPGLGGPAGDTVQTPRRPASGRPSLRRRWAGEFSS